MAKSKLKKNDVVKLLRGKDKGKSGRILKVYSGKGKVLVEGVNFIQKPFSVSRRGMPFMVFMPKMAAKRVRGKTITEKMVRVFMISEIRKFRNDS